MAIPQDVQETSIARYRDESKWEVYTSDSTFITLLRNQGYKPTRKEGGYSYYLLPLNRLTIRKSAPRKRRKIKEGTRVKLAANLVKARAARGKKKK